MHCVVTGLAAALLSATAITGTAWAQRAAAELEVQAGPAKRFPLVATIPRGETLQVHGCVESYAWCDVSRQDDRGWVTADQIEVRFQDRDVRVSEYGPRLQIPVVGFAFSAYWDAYYSGRPWYEERDRWKVMWRDQPEYLRYGRAERPTGPGGMLNKRGQNENFGAAAEEEGRAVLQRNTETRVERDDAAPGGDGSDRDSRSGERSAPSVSGPTPGNPTNDGASGSTSRPASRGGGSGSGTGASGSGGGGGGSGGGGGGS